MGCNSSKSDKGGQSQSNQHEQGYEQMSFQNFIKESNGDPKVDYKFGKKLGEGSFGTVYQVQRKDGKEIRAMKKILTSSLSKEELQKKMVNDITILRYLDHPNILKIFEFYKDDSYYYVVSEYCSGGELFDRISNQTTLTEREAANVIKQVLEVLRFANSKNVSHRDLKPENIMIDQKDITKEDYDVKIIDWGCSAKYMPGKFMTSLVGTPYYIAPEVIERKYTERCDVWSVGGILYWMLAGEPCFNGSSVDEVLNKVKNSQKWEFQGNVWKSVSEDAKDLIRKMMTYKPSERITVEKALEHRWIKNAPSKPISDEIRKECIEKMKVHRGKNQLANAALAFMTSQLVAKNDKAHLIQAFKTMDKNGDGTITVQEIREYYSSYSIDTGDLDAMIKNMDINGDGIINYTEFVNATIDKSKLMSEQRLKQTFDFFDEDKNGYITKDELVKVLGNHLADQSKSTFDDLIKESDSNKDGKISYEEFKNMMKKLI